MDRPTDELVQRLLAAVAADAGADAARLVDQARAEAEAEVKDLVKTAVKAVLLRRVVDALQGQPATHPVALHGAGAPTPPGSISAPALNGDAAEPTPDLNPRACYVYALARTDWGTPPADLHGIDGRSRVRTVREDDLLAVVSSVSPDEFGPGAIDRRLKDLQWVEAKVRLHDAVVKALSAAGTVIPCRFCTILSGEDQARAALARHRESILQTLDRIDGKTEWGVKLMADTRGGPAAAKAPATGSEPEGDAGRAYLMQKKRQGHGRQRDDVVRFAAEAAEACHRELFALAADAAILPTRDRGGTSRGWHLALNAAYLVAAADTQSFHARVSDLAQRYRPRGLRLDLTGPWPPYNFSALNLSEAPAE